MYLKTLTVRLSVEWVHVSSGRSVRARSIAGQRGPGGTGRAGSFGDGRRSVPPNQL